MLEINNGATYQTTYVYNAAGQLVSVTNALGHTTTTLYDTLGRKTRMEDPNMGIWTYTYTAAGDLQSQTDAKGQTLCFVYDGLARPKQKWQGQAGNCGVNLGTLTSWTYDTSKVSNPPSQDFPKGRLTRVVDHAGPVESLFAYDQLGRTTVTDRSIDGMQPFFRMTQQYDALGRIATETFPDGESVAYGYNRATWLESVSGYVTSIQYNARGQRERIQYANGVATNFTYDETSFRMQRRRTTFGGSTGGHNVAALTAWRRTWANAPGEFAPVYRGGICVADASGSCTGGDGMLEAGFGSAIGYLSTVEIVGTVPVYRSTCYSSAGTCAGWGLGLTPKWESGRLYVRDGSGQWERGKSVRREQRASSPGRHGNHVGVRLDLSPAAGILCDSFLCVAGPGTRRLHIRGDARLHRSKLRLRHHRAIEIRKPFDRPLLLLGRWRCAVGIH